MLFLTKLMLLTASQTDADLSTVLEETKAVAEEVHEDLQNLKPNVILDTLKSWLPGLMSFGYRLAIAILILVIGNRIVHVVRRFLQNLRAHEYGSECQPVPDFCCGCLHLRAGYFHCCR